MEADNEACLPPIPPPPPLRALTPSLADGLAPHTAPEGTELVQAGDAPGGSLYVLDTPHIQWSIRHTAASHFFPGGGS